jgi:hypothetical protein
MIMCILYVWLVLAQTPESVSPSGGDIVEHEATLWIESKMPADTLDAHSLLLQLVSKQKFDDVAAELARRNKQTATNRAVQMVTMSLLLRAVAQGQIEKPASKSASDGRSEPRFRTICRPYVDAVVLPEVSIPAAPELLDAQIKMVLIFQANTEEADRTQVRETAELRKEYVRRLCLVWSRLIKSCLVHRVIYPEDVMTGDAEWKRPEPPAFLFEFAAGISPKAIGDPAKRKAYEDYLAADKFERDRHRAATKTADLRKRHLETVRRSLVSMYGEDRSKWDELRQIVTETIKDPEVAKLVIKDFTQRKEPGVWP